MAYQQSWSLSQDVNKPSGTCSCCFAVRQLHLKDGTVHLHGPRSNPCPGSHKLPLSQPNLVLTTHSSQPSLQSSSQPNSTSVPPSTSTTLTPPFTHPSVNQPIIKHIPKSARPSCCSALSSLLLNVTRSPDDLNAWSNLFNFGSNTLFKPSRGGKRHNLTSIIKKRADDVLHSSTNGTAISSSLPSSAC